MSTWKKVWISTFFYFKPLLTDFILHWTTNQQHITLKKNLDKFISISLSVRVNNKYNQVHTWRLCGLFICEALAGDICGCCITLCGQGCMAIRGLCGHGCIVIRGLWGHDCMATRGLCGLVGWYNDWGLGLRRGRKLCRGLEARGKACIGLPGLGSIGLSRCKGCDCWHLIGLWPPVESKKLLPDWLLFSTTYNQHTYR